jgi:ABC-type multidrug transport system permease subunit
MAVSLLVSAMFPHLNRDHEFTGARNRNGVLFFVAAAVGYIAAQYVILVFPHERPVFLREIGSNMYSVGPYFLGRFIAELPGGIIAPVLFGSIMYPIVGLNTVFAWKFPLFRKFYLASLSF